MIRMNKLKEIREKRKLSIKEAAKILGLRNDIYSMIEDGLLDDNELIIKQYSTFEFKLKNQKKTNLLCTNQPIVLTLQPFKGGTGKTTSIINIGSCLAEMGYQVLLVDTTGQCDVTQMFLDEEYIELGDKLSALQEQGKEITEDDITIHSLLEALHKGDDIRNYIMPTRKHDFIDVIPSEVDMKTVYSDFLQNRPMREQILQKAFRGVMKENFYDFILIDVENNAERPWKHAIYNITPNPVYVYAISECAEESQQLYPVLLGDIEFDKEWVDFEFLGVALSRVSQASKPVYEEGVTTFKETLPPEYQLQTQLRQDITVTKSKQQHILITQMSGVNRLKIVQDSRSLTNELLEKIKKFEKGE